MYGTNFNPKIFTDITIPDIKFYSPHTGKITQQSIPTNLYSKKCNLFKQSTLASMLHLIKGEKMVRENLISKIEIPNSVLQKWQDLADIMAKLLKVPAGLIMRITEPDIEVFISSHSDNNPYKPRDKEHLWGSGLYCETVITAKSKLLVPNALSDNKWKNNPDIELDMISYLGFPLLFPDETPFGTICVLDNKENAYNETYENLILNFRGIIEGHLELLYMNHILGEKNEQLSDYISEIQTLRGILPLCSFCKKIRDDKGYWEQVDVYIHKHSQADISHSICPDCAKEHYPDLELFDD